MELFDPNSERAQECEHVFLSLDRKHAVDMIIVISSA